MAKYISSDLFNYSFKRLSSRNQTGKTHLERTSALMYFLAFDATLKFLELKVLDINPDTLAGKENRKHYALEFEKLVLLERNSELKQVLELGKITTGETHPEKRISSNFFTVPVKKASTAKQAFFYPGRPAPLLKMGFAATGVQWGIDFHDEWQKNFLKFFTKIVSNTPFHDLAVFVLRGQSISDDSRDLISALAEHIQTKFTKKLSDFWLAQMNKEKVFFRYQASFFSDHYSGCIKDNAVAASSSSIYDGLTREELIEVIQKLELELSIKCKGHNQ